MVDGDAVYKIKNEFNLKSLKSLHRAHNWDRLEAEACAPRDWVGWWQGLPGRDVTHVWKGKTEMCSPSPVPLHWQKAASS